MLNIQLIKEAIVVGIATVIVGYLVYKSTKKLDINQKVKNLLNLFITGLVIHLVCEYSGINKWYCKNGNACQKQ